MIFVSYIANIFLFWLIIRHGLEKQLISSKLVRVVLVSLVFTSNLLKALTLPADWGLKEVKVIIMKIFHLRKSWVSVFSSQESLLEVLTLISYLLTNSPIDILNKFKGCV